MGRQRLRDINLATHYRSDREDVVAQFYLPAMSMAARYDRAVGYFTSTSLALFARGLDQFAARDGTIRLVASPHLTPDDIEQIDRGYEVRDVLARAALRALDSEPDNERVLAGLGMLARLVATGALDIKLAIVRRGPRVGLYHEKIGTFRDDTDIVAFTGSANETHGGLLANFETVEVFRSWDPGDAGRAYRLQQDFEDLWADRTPSLQVVAFPEVAIERLYDIAATHRTPLAAKDDALTPLIDDRPTGGALRLPDRVEFRDYQKAAVEAWMRADGRGILKMATGTGKTKTALAAATQLARLLRQHEQRLVTIILVPYQHLVDQWLEEVALFGARAEPAYESSQRWRPRVTELVNAVDLGAADGATIVATNTTFTLEPFQQLLRRIHGPALLIADESHNLGSQRLRAMLPPHIGYRLALSATPERWFDDTGTDALRSYFGDVVFELGLGEAIERGALCHYTYHPRLVELTEDEAALYVEVSDAIAACLANSESLPEDVPDDGPLGQLLRKRTQILGHAAGKINAFRKDITERSERWWQLVYCAEGRRPEQHGYASEPRQIDQMLDLVGNDLGLAAHHYVAETPRATRRELLRRFGTGDDLRVLLSMKCLDEGVDIPDARVAYLLASSSNPRQFVQRRGRILRTANGKTHAEIFDYLAIPPPGVIQGREQLERALLARELVRAAEFGKLADNYGQTLTTLRPLKERYGLMDL